MNFCRAPMLSRRFCMRPAAGGRCLRHPIPQDRQGTLALARRRRPEEISVREAARRAEATVPTIYSRIYSGELPARGERRGSRTRWFVRARAVAKLNISSVEFQRARARLLREVTQEAREGARAAADYIRREGL